MVTRTLSTLLGYLMISLITPEQERIEVIASEYRDQGYEVFLQPSSQILPEFLKEFQMDLLVRKDNKFTVVEVRTRQALSEDLRIREMARVLQQEDDWKFELVVIGSDQGEFSFQQSLQEEEVFESFDEALTLLDGGYVNAAMLLSWSSTEAGLRLIGDREDPPITQKNPHQLIKLLVMEGVISRDDYEFLLSVMKKRNAVAHGYKVSDDEVGIVQKLIERMKYLLLTQQGFD